MQARFIDSLCDIPAEIWDGVQDTPYLFTRHAFLSALEESGSLALERGWKPHHLLFLDEAETIIGVAPCYLKMHSMGEYVFDHQWADIWQRAGGHYYPKLSVAIPFSPITGPRILTQKGQAVKRKMLTALKEECDVHHFSSLHMLFPDPHALEAARQEKDFLIRQGHQFHWHNRGYKSFDDFLSTLSSRKRKTIKKERMQLKKENIHFQQLTGADLNNSEIWDFFYRCYQATYDRKWGYPYLTRDFFTKIVERAVESILLVIAKKEDGENIAAALNFMDDTALYGRNWGCVYDVPFLHFEVCYYQAIEFALKRGLKRVEAGTQGEHKLQRGYELVSTYSAHYLPHPEFRKIIGSFLQQEEGHEEALGAYYEARKPFKKRTPTF